ncbi:MAG: metal ABC transporter ATP-binding protein [Actinomycetota bacterium]|nr:metal ABC transporter ATP-binding protein [Actinomycetota bacterium]MDQ3432720.1 metal ABC transporter ATP-binding protein [Actinomycetota bacterium]
MPTPALHVQDVTVALGGRPVVRRVDLDVGPGEFVTVIGGNGSGKSTLVRAATGLVPITSGGVRLFGVPLASFGDWQRIGYVPQRPSAASGVPATVREVVTAGRLSRRRLLRSLGRGDRAAVDTALAAVDLADRAGDSVVELSGGQQQRVLIARALATEADLLVLDEPTAGVDLAHQQLLTDVLAAYSARGVAIVLVAHELGPLARLVDRVVVMRDGRVVFDGTPDAEAAAFSHSHQDHHHPTDPHATGPPGGSGMLGPGWQASTR